MQKVDFIFGLYCKIRISLKLKLSILIWVIYGYYIRVFLFRRNTIMYVKMYWIQFSIFPFSLKQFHRRDRYLPRVTRETEAK